MPKSTQTRYLGIRDNHNHYTSLRLLFLIIILMSTHALLGVFLICMWEKLMFSLSIIFILLLTIYDPHATQKASVGMYSGYDCLLSLKILFVCFLALPSLLHPSILFNCFYTCFCSFLLHECNYIYIKLSIDGWCRSSRVRVKW